MGRTVQRSAGARATPTGGLKQGSQGAGLYRRPTVVLVRSPRRLLAAFGVERAVRRPTGRDLRRPLNGTFAALSPLKAC